ncbi:uncharacterized protein N7496_000642 [Penicillium cataractarum]|uniref:BZIP domain-containing protein n=1 Tax=Penicillium cataractarum TaxID=2100454 RepID=A0A9W9VUR3_9EURO|nr:uncharacterized protein N7496_000642 [Penicillium cataractarum]KAJ5389574.1 hypothetical protein N7496_000642 [Penicillium cataractarum]
MATLLYPSNSGIALDGSINRSPLQTLQPTTPSTELPWLSPFTPSQYEKDGLLRTPFEKQLPKMSNIPAPNLEPAQPAQPVQRTRRSSTKSRKQNEDISPERAKHLERNRISANKCRMKKKKEHARMESLLSTETAKRDSLLSEVGLLKDELWYLKNMIFEHAQCEHQSINNQLVKMTQAVLESSSGQLKCPSPAFSSSTWSDGSVLEEPGQPEHPVTLPAGVIGYGECPDTMFESFLDLPAL